MVILREEKDIQNPYLEYWLTDPLEQLWDPKKVRIVWRWADQPDCQIIKRWERPENAPSKGPNNFSFRIGIDVEWLQNSGIRFDQIYLRIISKNLETEFE